MIFYYTFFSSLWQMIPFCIRDSPEAGCFHGFPAPAPSRKHLFFSGKTIDAGVGFLIMYVPGIPIKYS